MGLRAVVGTMLFIACLTWILSRSDPRAAYRLLEHSQQHFFESDDAPRPSTARAVVASQQRRGNPTARRQYISPLSKKRVAARQGWRCAICKELLDETFEIDHIIPLFKGGDATNERNLQALCKRDHVWKSALDARL